MKLRIACAVGCLIAGAWAAGAATRSPAALKRLFPLEAEILAEQTGLVRLILTPEVLAAARPDLSDLRVFDSRDRELAFLLDSGGSAVEVEERFEPRVLGLKREEREPERGLATTVESYQIEAPPEAPEHGSWELAFRVREERFVRQVTIAALAASGREETLVEATPLFRLDPATHLTRIPLPAFEASALRVRIEGAEGFFLEPRFAFESRRTLGPLERSVVPLEELSREQRDGKTVVELTRPGGIVPDRIRLETSTGSFDRGLTVWDEQPGRADTRLGAGRVFRVAAPRAVDRLELAVRKAKGATLRIEIEDGDSPALEEIRFSGVVRQPVLIFELNESPGTLRFGGGRAHRPRYDLASLLLGARRSMSGPKAEAAVRLYDPAELPVVQLGPVRPNPAFDATPALSFAMHPGAEIDPGAYSHRRPVEIAPSDEGLSRLRLAPEDAALSRADLADVRIVGNDSRQWPYLMKRDAYSQRLELEIDEVETHRRTTTYRLALPIAPLRVDRLTLRSPAAFFDRPYRLEGIDEDGEARLLSQGRLVKGARDPKPVRISFARQSVYAFELSIEDGDDAPLVFDAVRSRTRLPEIFLVAPAGHYALLVGNPDASPPRFELERVRDVVLAVSGNPATTQPLEPNPAYSLAARLRSEGGASELLRTAVVWGVLLVAVAVLATLTWRVARQEPSAAPPDGER